MRQVCRGVHAAHANGVIHHDLKPANVLIDEEGQPKVTDFGISVTAGSLPGPDRPRGNLAFAAPEQLDGNLDDVSTATDVYALGAMLFWLLTGRLPHGTRKEDIERWHARDPERRRADLADALRDGPRDLRALCLRAMDPDPAHRHPSASMLADDLDAWLAGHCIAWTRPSPLRRSLKWTRRRPLVASMLVIGALGLVFGGVMAYRATLASVRLQSYNQSRLESLAKIRAMRERFGENEFETQVLAYLWLLDSLSDRALFGSFDMDAFLWEQRRTLGERALTRVPEDSLAALLWQTQLALWLVQSLEHEPGTVEMAERAQANARRMLEPDDPWHRDLALIAASARVKRAIHEQPGEPLETALAELDREIERTTGWRTKSPLYEVAVTWGRKARGEQPLDTW